MLFISVIIRAWLLENEFVLLNKNLYVFYCTVRNHLNGNGKLQNSRLKQPTK